MGPVTGVRSVSADFPGLRGPFAPWLLALEQVTHLALLLLGAFFFFFKFRSDLLADHTVVKDLDFLETSWCCLALRYNK